MNWDTFFAKRTHSMRRTAVRELLRVAAQPGVISFAGGLPAAELFPIKEIQKAAESVLSTCPAKALQYGETEGVAELRCWIEERLKVRHSNVLITSGAQQALDLLGRVFLDQEDAVLVENPTYLAALSAWRPLGVRFISTFDGTTPKMVYRVPNYQNPQGTTLSVEERVSLLNIAHERGCAIVEDDPYRELCFEGRPLPTLYELQRAGEATVINVGTFSKVLVPGLRVGWIVGPEILIEKLVQAKQAVDLHTSTFNQYLILDLITNGVLEVQIPRLRRCYRERRDAMLAALQADFPEEASWTRPAGGMFLMVRLPESVDAAEVLNAALERGVAFVPGEEFFIDRTGKNTMRLNFSNATPERIETGVRRLGELVKAHIAEMCCQKCRSAGL